MEKSLQTLKNDIAKKEETLKNLLKNHPHLAHLSEVQILAYFEVDTIPDIERHIHANIIEENINLCSCTDSKGQPKDLYNSEESAQRDVNTLVTQKRLKLKVYPCPACCGWHLSKS